MLTNAAEPAVRGKLDQELGLNPAFSLVVELIRSSPEPFAIEPTAAGIEIVPLNQVKQAPNRSRLKLFRPREEKERLCAFFFKRSNLEFSRDRFSYGAVEALPEQIRETEVRSWIEWLVSGLDPDHRPDRIRRAFLYTIPE